MSKAYQMNPVAPMTAGVLRELLGQLPPDSEVLLFSDAEGNDIKPLLAVELSRGKAQVKAGYGSVKMEGRGLPPAFYLIPYD